jgi:hypothetical protein
MKGRESPATPSSKTMIGRESPATPLSSVSQQGRQSKLSSSSPTIVDEKDVKKKTDEEEEEDQSEYPSILTSPLSSSSSVTNSSKRRRNKKKKGSAVSASLPSDIPQMSLLNESMDIPASSSIAKQVLNDDETKQKSDKSFEKEKDDDDKFINKMTQKAEDASSDFGSMNVQTPHQYRGPIVPWAQVLPNADPTTFNAWGKFVYATMRGTVKPGDVFS